MAHLWSGRFEGGPDAALFEFGASFGFDRRLFEDDVTGSLAWAEAIGAAGVLSPQERDAIRAALEEILDHGPRSGVLRLSQPRRTTRTSTRSSSASWCRASAKPGAGCTRDARATSRSRSTCGCI